MPTDAQLAVTVPVGDAVRAFAWGVAVGGLLLGGVCWWWAASRGWCSGYRAGYDVGHAQGWIKGVNDAGVADAPRRPEDAPGRDLAARLRLHAAAVRVWEGKGRR